MFTLEREKKTRDVEIEKKKKDHMKDRRKGARSGTHLLKKHRPAGMGKNVKKWIKSLSKTENVSNL